MFEVSFLSIYDLFFFFHIYPFFLSSVSSRALIFILLFCLELTMEVPRFASELAGRKARKTEWDGLGRELETGGWFARG
jgi:hypothetical protein